MYVSNSKSINPLLFFKERAVQTLSKQQQLIAIIALALFSLIALFYLNRRWNKKLKIERAEIDRRELDNQLDEIIKPEAQFIYKNASSLREANVILLGENHSLRAHKVLESAIIKHYAKAGDIVLVEGILHKEEGLDSETEELIFDRCLLPRDRSLKYNGWEEINTFSKSSEIIPVYQRCIDETEFVRINGHFSDEQMALEILQNFDQTLENFYQSKLARDQVLISCINDYIQKYPDKKLFIIAGWSHLLEYKPLQFEPLLLENNPNPQFNILDHLTPESKCACIIFKNNKTTPKPEIALKYNLGSLTLPSPSM